jgi:hypothetical protein
VNETTSKRKTLLANPVLSGSDRTAETVGFGRSDILLAARRDEAVVLLLEET